MPSPADLLTAEPISPDPADRAEVRRPTERRVEVAIDLGWRVAELYSLNMQYEPTERAWQLLPSRRSLSRRDRLELELLAAAGAARRLDLDISQERIEELLELAGDAAARMGAETKFREELEHCHVALDKYLWTHNESEGRGYELGIMLSDTYNRISRVYREHPDAARDEWLAVFTHPRATQLKILLDDLQSRLDPGAVTVVRDHLNAWRDRVGQALGDGQEPTPPCSPACRQVWRQTVVWRQLLTGDKEPEAFLGPRSRARVRDELLRLMWRRYWAWAIGLFALLAAGTAALLLARHDIGHWYAHNTSTAALVTGAVVSLAGALGITQASVNRAIRDDLRTWSRLLWNRALARVVCQETLRIERVFPAPPCRRRRVVATLTRTYPVRLGRSGMFSHPGQGRFRSATSA